MRLFAIEELQHALAAFKIARMVRHLKSITRFVRHAGQLDRSDFPDRGLPGRWSSSRRGPTAHRFVDVVRDHQYGWPRIGHDLHQFVLR